MPKIDYEKAIKQFYEVCIDRGWNETVAMLEGALRTNTHRTEEDLPRDGVWWVRDYRGWFLTLWEGRVITAACHFSWIEPGNWPLKLVSSAVHDSLNKNKLHLEIGPRIQPPEEES